MNQELPLNYHSVRAQKARFARRLGNKYLQAVISAFAVTFTLSGAALIIFASQPIGWSAVALAAPLLMLAVWYKGELESIPPLKDGKTIDALADSGLLGKLPANYSPQDLSVAVMQLRGGQFFAARFGIGPSFLQVVTSHQPQDTPKVWAEAEALRQHFNQPGISAAMVAAALVRTLPDADNYLARLQLGRDDLLAGVGWYHHIEDLIFRHRKRVSNGGIGRDWSFGYTPLLGRLGLNISENIAFGGMFTRELEAHQDLVKQMMGLMSQGGRQNATLVGPTGAGKTTLVYAMAQKLLEASPDTPRSLRYRQIIALDPATLIGQARGRGELESLVHQLFLEAYSAKNVILFLDDAQLFFEEAVGSVDLSNVLLPILEGGSLRLIIAMDEQRWLRISQVNPALAQYLNRIVVTPTTKDDTMLIIEDQLVAMEFRYKVSYMYQACEEAYRLADRYMTDQAMPGKALKLLESAAGFAENGLVTNKSVKQAIEKTVGVKVGSADTSDEREKLLNLEQYIHQRMINQTRAVSVVSDALRRARAGVRNPDRPIGTFLFLGPTGVGKTELAKSLAAVFFGGEDRLVRLDLNEYVRSEDVVRLIADGAKDQHSLTAQIAKQPFSVVLLDEIEKAHPDVLNTLLQLLDEGVLRDINNRAVSFRDAIVIATSNAGADRIREHIEKGEELQQFEQQFIDELINSNQFRPEFLNRFDEIVLFRPLNMDELMQVIDLILVGVNKNLAIQKVSLHVADDAKQLLVQAGYDPRLGARPMRRIVQRAVENIVAKRMLSGQVPPGSVIEVTAADVQAILGQVRS